MPMLHWNQVKGMNRSCGERCIAMKHPEDDMAPVNVATPLEGMFADTPDTVAEFEPGYVLANQFEILQLVGRGGMGIVYRVKDRLTDQQLALKVIFPSVLSQPRAAEIFLQEVNTARRLRHPGVVAIYDVRHLGPLVFFTMEFVNGQTLRAILKKHGRLSPGKAVGVIVRLCRVLDHVHRVTVHRGICPENIMILPDASVRLLDIGMARAVDAAMTARGMRAGRAFYTAPEQCEDPAVADVRGDVYSLGVVLFEMLTGGMPSGYARIAEVCPEIPPVFDRAVAYALAPLERRCPTVRALAEAVLWCYKHSEKAQVLPAPPSTPVADLPRVMAAEDTGGKSPRQSAQHRRRSPLVHSTMEREWEAWEAHRKEVGRSR